MVMTRIAQEANGTFRFNDVPEGRRRSATVADVRRHGGHG